MSVKVQPHDVATWRFEQISPFLGASLSEADRRRLMRERPAMVDLDGKRRRIPRSTLHRWLGGYREHGYEALMPKQRSDAGKPRTDLTAWILYAIGLLLEQPGRSLLQLDAYLRQKFESYSVPRSTLSRHLRVHPAYSAVERLRSGTKSKLYGLYEASRPHESWQLDGKGPFSVRLQSGEVVRVHVLSVLDDYSRSVLAAIVAPAEDARAAIAVFQKAALRYGLPERMQFDRGSAFDSDAFRHGLAQCGVHRSFVRAKQPTAQGKIEAYHRPLTRWFVNELAVQQVVDLDHLQQLLDAMLALVYQPHHHRAIGCSPEARLAGRCSERRIAEADLAKAFFVQGSAKSHAKTGEIQLANGRFRVPQAFAGKHVKVCHDPLRLRAFLVTADGREIELAPFVMLPLPPPRQGDPKRGEGQLLERPRLLARHATPQRRARLRPARGLRLAQRPRRAHRAGWRPRGARRSRVLEEARSAPARTVALGLHPYPRRARPRPCAQRLSDRPRAARRRRQGDPMIRSPFPYRDFVRVKDAVRTALCELEETYVLVTGETGTGKTMLLRSLKAELDRARYRIFYFPEARRLGASGLIRVVAKGMRVPTSLCHWESLDKLLKSLADDGQAQKLLLWFDEAHELPEETLAEARAFAESDLDGHSRVQVLLVGLPRLRADLQALPHLWRRIVVREEITGLQIDEMPALLEHHFGAVATKRLCEHGIAKLFERAKGSPGVALPMCRRVLASSAAKGRIEPELVDEALHAWDMP